MAVLCQVMPTANSIFNYDLIMTSQTPYDAHQEVVINHSKFDAYTSSS